MFLLQVVCPPLIIIITHSTIDDCTAVSTTDLAQSYIQWGAIKINTSHSVKATHNDVCMCP